MSKMDIFNLVRNPHGSIPRKNLELLDKSLSLIYNEKIKNKLVENLPCALSTVGRTFLFIYILGNFFSCKDVAPSVYLPRAGYFYCLFSSC